MKFEEYDFQDADAFIAKNRINKLVDVDEYMQECDQLIAGLGKLPDPEVEFYECRIALKKDFDRPWGGNDYMHCPEMYCGAIKRKLEHEVGEFFEQYPDGIPEEPWYTIFPPADLIPLHDAIFVEGETQELLDPLPEPKRKKNWWDEDVIKEEYDGLHMDDYSAAFRVDWYLRQTEKEKPDYEPLDYVPLEYQDSSWSNSMRSSCGGYPQDDEYSLHQWANS